MRTAEISSNIGECHLSDAVFICSSSHISGLTRTEEEISTYRVDELDACKVHVILGVFVDDFRVVNGFGTDVLVSCHKSAIGSR